MGWLGAFVIVNPARAGMIRNVDSIPKLRICKPRASGDDPFCSFAIAGDPS